MQMDVDIKKEKIEPDLSANLPLKKTPLKRFIITSGFVHIITASAILITNHTPKNERENEIVEIQMSTPSEVATAPEIAATPEQIEATEDPAADIQTHVAAKTQAFTETETTAESLIPPLAPEVATFQTIKPPVSAPKTGKPVLKQAPVATINDIEPPALDDSTVPLVATTKDESLTSQDLDQDLNTVDEQQEKQLQEVKNQLEEETNQTATALAEKTDMVADEVKKEDQAAASQLRARVEEIRRQEEAAQAEASAKQQAAESAKANSVAAAKKQEGQGQKNAGPGVVATEVRALEQLRQMPGNPKPQYETEERLRGDTGVVVFQAYVTQSGSLNEFKMLQSSGHRNLDAKTLKALKQWKFYPGQEGWVELPTNWNLKGGPQEMPAFLRRKVGKNP